MIPQRINRWAANLSSLGGFLLPDQEMTNIFSKEFYDAGRKDPPYIPFVIPKLHEKPWMVPLSSHERAAKSWRESVSNKPRDGSQQVNLQAWILYMLRFIFTGDLCDSWQHFGGLSAQLSLLSIVLHLAVVETANFAIAYDCELRARIQRLARKRDSKTDIIQMLTEENDEVKRYLKNDLGKGKNAKGSGFDPNRRRFPPNVPPIKGTNPPTHGAQNVNHKGVRLSINSTPLAFPKKGGWRPPGAPVGKGRRFT